MLQRSIPGLLNKFGKSTLLNFNGAEIRSSMAGTGGGSLSIFESALCDGTIVDPIAIDASVPTFKTYCSTGTVTINVGITLTVDPYGIWRFS